MRSYLMVKGGPIPCGFEKLSEGRKKLHLISWQAKLGTTAMVRLLRQSRVGKATLASSSSKSKLFVLI